MVGNERSGNQTNHGSTRANAQRVFLPTELWLGLQKLIAKYEIGRAAACLYCINETLHQEGFIDSETYKTFKEKYLEPLLDIVKRNRTENKPLTKKQLEEQRKLEEWSKRFSDMAKEWNEIPEKSQKYYMAKARELIDKVPEAQKILDKSEVRVNVAEK